MRKRRHFVHRARPSEAQASRFGEQTIAPANLANLRRTVVRCQAVGWSKPQIAARCHITEAEVDAILAMRGQRSPRTRGGQRRGVHATTRNRGVIPSGISAEPHTVEWFEQNQHNFVEGLRKLGLQPQEIRNG